MFDSVLRPIKEHVFLPLTKLISCYLSANQLTLISLLLGFGSLIFIAMDRLTIALIFWIFNRLTDGLDGSVARFTQTQSDLGGYLDIMSDFLLYSLIPIIFVLTRGEKLELELLYLAIMLGVFYINAASWMYLSSVLEKRANSNQDKMTSVIMPTGVVEGFETIIIYTLFYLFPGKLVLLFGIMIVLTFIGAIQRIIWAIRNIS